MTDEEYREAARENYNEEELQVDGDALVSRGSDAGAWVQAWVWVEDPSGRASELDDPDNEPEDGA